MTEFHVLHDGKVNLEINGDKARAAAVIIQQADE